MKPPVVIIGIGELGGVFARGFLRLGYPVYPVTRAISMATVAERLPEPELVLVAAAEGDLPSLLAVLPDPWRDRVGLLQNELLPAHWEGIRLVPVDNSLIFINFMNRLRAKRTDSLTNRFFLLSIRPVYNNILIYHKVIERNNSIPTPTVISVWIEKKPGTDYKVIIPSPVFGPRSDLLAGALATLHIPTRVLAGPDELLFELVVKNLYILTTNIAGLRVGGNVGELWSRHRDLARRIGEDVIRLQEALTGRCFERDALFAVLAETFAGDPSHGCMGRSAPTRLARALAEAERQGLDLPALRELQADLA